MGFLKSLAPYYLKMLPERFRKKIRPFTIDFCVSLAMRLSGNKICNDKYTMFLDPNDRKGLYSFLSWLEKGNVVWEPFEVSLFLGSIGANPGSVVIDIGANYGMYTLEAASPHFNNRPEKIIAIEPDKKVFACLKRSVKATNCEKGVTLVNAAVSVRHNELCRLYHSCIHEKQSSFNIAVGPGQDVSVSNSFKPAYAVRGITLDGLLDEMKVDKEQRFIIKIDIEGNEAVALQGLEDTLSKCRGYHIFLEYAPKGAKRFGHSPSLLANRILSLRPDAILEILEDSHELRKISPERWFREFRKNVGNLLLSKNMKLPHPLLEEY